MATADVDLVITADRLEGAPAALQECGFTTKKFDWSINLGRHSEVTVQISTEDFHRDFPSRSAPADVHGILMRVASLGDTVAGKLKALNDPDRRPGKRQKDLADIARLIETRPEFLAQVPAEVLKRIDA